jgi:hypothetical protein
MIRDGKFRKASGSEWRSSTRRSGSPTSPSPQGAVIREAREELGIQLSEGDIRHTATVHCRNTDSDIRIGLFFQAAANDAPAPWASSSTSAKPTSGHSTGRRHDATNQAAVPSDHQSRL